MKILLAIIFIIWGLVIGIGIVEDYQNNPLNGCRSIDRNDNFTTYQCKTVVTYYEPNN